jgi:hypothetical protein
MDASSARAAEAPQKIAAAIISPLNPPFKNLSFREVIMAYSSYEFGNILPQSAQKVYPPKLGGACKSLCQVGCGRLLLADCQSGYLTVLP